MLTSKIAATPSQRSPTGRGTVRRLKSSRDSIYLYEYEGCSLRYDSEYLNFLFELDSEAKERTMHEYFKLPFSIGGIWNYNKGEEYKGLCTTLCNHINIALGLPKIAECNAREYLASSKYAAFAEYIDYLLKPRHLRPAQNA